MITEKDKVYLEKKKFVEGEPDIKALEKRKYVIERDAPKHSKIPVITA